MHQGDCLSNFHKDCKSNLPNIYHYPSLALQETFYWFCVLLQLSWKEYHIVRTPLHKGGGGGG